MKRLLIALTLLVWPLHASAQFIGGGGGGSGSGTVTSVGLSLPSIMTVTNSPVTSTGNLTAVLASQTQNLFFASPNGSSGLPLFRAIVAADIPTLNQNTSGTAAGLSGANLSGDVTNSGNSVTVTKVNGNTPGVSAVSNQFVTSIDSSARGTLAQPAFSNLSGSVAASQMPALTGDITTSAGAAVTTLATVNSNVGSFGSATAAPSVTVNAKGLVTAASSSTITPAESSVTFTDITTGNVSTSKHGYAPKGDGNAAHFLDGNGTYSTPSSSGITTLNTLTGATQTFATGTSGSDFGISSSGTAHTFNIPDASASARGLVTTGSQTFAGTKTFSGQIIASDGGSATTNNIQFAGIIQGAGMNWNGATDSTVFFAINSTNIYALKYNVFGVRSDNVIAWNSSSSAATSGNDTGVSRATAGVVAIGTGAGATRDGWLNWGGECYVTSNQTNATTTLQTTNCLVNGTDAISVISGRKYAIMCEFFTSDSVSVDGAKLDFGGGSASATDFRAQVTAFDSALNLSTQLTSLTGVATASTFTGAGAFEIHGSFEPSSNGTFIPRFAQASHSTGTLTIARGSHCVVHDMQ